MNERILIVEDNKTTANFLEAALKLQGYDVRVVGDGLSALEQVEADPPDLILLDLVIPRMSGLEVCRRVRQRGPYIPIVMLTGQTDEQDRITGLETGADDYITKPFGVQELMARVRAMFRLFHQARTVKPGPDRVQVEDLVIDHSRRTVAKGDVPVELTPKEFDLLAALAWERGRVFEREELFKLVWGYDFVGKSRTLDVHVQQLRSKIEADPANPRYLLTVRGVGYKFAAEEDIQGHSPGV